MKTIYLILFILCILLNTLTAQWERCNGPYGGVIKSLLAYDDIVFAGTSAGLYKSTNKGDNWVLIDSLSSNFGYVCIVKYENKIYLCSEGGGVFYSTNNGLNWTAIHKGLPSSSKRAIAIK
ncbi:MAG TPA: hypothetical protein PK762_12175, partial [Candidatus Kapabacteria bacterium]|nr:hypothetical protein [Candidatus Kapabacteria bacterium]